MCWPVPLNAGSGVPVSGGTEAPLTDSAKFLGALRKSAEATVKLCDAQVKSGQSGSVVARNLQTATRELIVMCFQLFFFRRNTNITHNWKYFSILSVEGMRIKRILMFTLWMYQVYTQRASIKRMYVMEFQLVYVFVYVFVYVCVFAVGTLLALMMSGSALSVTRFGNLSYDTHWVFNTKTKRLENKKVPGDLTILTLKKLNRIAKYVAQVLGERMDELLDMDNAHTPEVVSIIKKIRKDKKIFARIFNSAELMLLP